ncbi:hypothetical protein [Nocardia camponoti]|uniref:Uncharacterized protein n=1 Tax=Nocardia camponoti TaxID=1616106 RepID=A0A917QJW6_9NOCA|nr:hypothetical protein [Nocardia camponoti]GGK53384.1 hypothetical protein GCM10011591_26490 [Nocardia camponoti]
MFKTDRNYGRQVVSMKYREPDPITRVAARAMLESGITEQIESAIIRLALPDPDGDWVVAQALELLKSNVGKIL